MAHRIAHMKVVVMEQQRDQLRTGRAHLPLWSLLHVLIGVIDLRDGGCHVPAAGDSNDGGGGIQVPHGRTRL